MPLLQIGVKWGKEALEVEVDTSGTGLDLKTQLFSLTGVPPDRIKLMGLKGGKAVADETPLGTCGLDELAKKKKKLLMMGSTAAVIQAPTKEITFVEDLPEDAAGQDRTLEDVPEDAGEAYSLAESIAEEVEEDFEEYEETEDSN